ncbi:MAG: hypothetical protein ACJ72R_15120, partial [Nitrososphaeraceae archaeon]
TAVGNGTFELSHRMATSSIRDEVQEQAAKDAAHREIAMCLLSSHMLLNWLKILATVSYHLTDWPIIKLYNVTTHKKHMGFRCGSLYGI